MPPGELTQTSPERWLIRFALGAGVSGLAGVVSALAGPRLGGIFLAFPVILLASLTLVPREEGARQVRIARGSAYGALGLLAFAIVVAATVTRWPVWASFTGACLSWALVALGGYLIAKGLPALAARIRRAVITGRAAGSRTSTIPGVGAASGSRAGGDAMRANVRLGSLAGIPISANIGVLVIILLVGFGLAGGRFPLLYPGRSTFAYVLAGVVAGLLLAVSILIHELAHAVVARANGITVEGITLWLLGGVARLRGEPRSPAADLAVAAVGPATSLALGGVFAVVAFAVDAIGVVGDLAVATLAYLAGANVLLALFNLVPAAPLDGGRVLRAVLWWRTGDRSRAAVSAARAGRGFGLALIILGIAQVILLRGFGGLWLALIGWFLVHAASAEEQQVRLGQRLRGVRVRDVMSTSAVTAPADANVDDFIEQVVLRQPYSTYPLVDSEGRLTGLVTLNRIRALPADRRAQTHLGDIACPSQDVPTATPDDAVTDLLPRIDGCSDGRAVALDEHRRVVGVVSPRDIARLASAAELRAADPYPPQGADLTTRD